MLFLVTVPVAIVACFILPERSAAELSPTTVTLLALAVSLWVALSAERDARARLERAKRAYAVHGETTRLLRDHRLVHLVAMLRLEIVVGCAVATAVWGAGPVTGAWIAAMAGVLMLLAWPNERKTLLLIERAEEKRVRK